VVTRSEAAIGQLDYGVCKTDIVYTILDGISPQSRGLIKALGLEKYRQKVLA
jgi:hypothetical protein